MKGNGKGPEDKGPGTGRKLGFCYGWGKPGYRNDNVIGAPKRPGLSLSHSHRNEMHNNSEHNN